MPAVEFMIVPKQILPDGGRQRDIIASIGTFCRVHVYHISREPFYPNKEELQFFGWHNEYIAFETENWSKKQLHLVTAAIKWYAAHIGCPDMDISLVPPKSTLRLV